MHHQHDKCHVSTRSTILSWQRCFQKQLVRGMKSASVHLQQLRLHHDVTLMLRYPQGSCFDWTTVCSTSLKAHKKPQHCLGVLPPSPPTIHIYPSLTIVCQGSLDAPHQLRPAGGKLRNSRGIRNHSILLPIPSYSVDTTTGQREHMTLSVCFCLIFEI